MSSALFIGRHELQQPDGQLQFKFILAFCAVLWLLIASVSWVVPGANGASLSIYSVLAGAYIWYSYNDGFKSFVALDFDTSTILMSRTRRNSIIDTVAYSAIDLTKISVEINGGLIHLDLRRDGFRLNERISLTTWQVGKPDIEPLKVAQELARIFNYSKPIHQYYESDSGGGG